MFQKQGLKLNYVIYAVAHLLLTDTEIDDLNDLECLGQILIFFRNSVWAYMLRFSDKPLK